MLLLCDNTVGLPLRIIFEDISLNSTYMWKLANVTPIFKKGEKQLITTIGQSSPNVKRLKTLSSIIFTAIFIANSLITKNQSGFRPG